MAVCWHGSRTTVSLDGAPIPVVAAACAASASGLGRRRAVVGMRPIVRMRTRGASVVAPGHVPSTRSGRLRIGAPHVGSLAGQCSETGSAWSSEAVVSTAGSQTASHHHNPSRTAASRCHSPCGWTR